MGLAASTASKGRMTTGIVVPARKASSRGLGLRAARLHARRRGQIQDEAERGRVVEDDVPRVLDEESVTEVRLGPHGRGREALAERVERVVLVLRPVEAVEQLVEVQVEEDNEARDAEDLCGRPSSERVDVASMAWGV